jgi:peptide/nickel transport system substrate-binding protein
MFPEKPGVMASRELTAEDVLFTQRRYATSPKQVGDFYNFIEKSEARDSHTLVYDLNEYVADWQLRFGFGYTTAVMPKEVADAGAKDWKNANGTGPFRLVGYVSGNSNTYEKNPIYWDHETIAGSKYRLPFVDKLTYRIIKDQATQVTALRTGKLDLLEIISWEQVESLKKSSPALQWNRWLSGPYLLAMRVDTKPFDDIRVRRALNMAIDKQEIIKSFFGGNAEMLTFPLHPEWLGYHEPLESMPESIKELFQIRRAKSETIVGGSWIRQRL